MNLPVDFEEKVKRPPTINGRSYPYQISARDLMQNFRYSALQVDDTEVSGLKLIETALANGVRTVKLSGELEGGGVGGSNHPFKVTYSDSQYNIVGGECAGILVPDDTFSEAATPSFIYAKIEREPSSRDVVDSTLEIAGALPASDQEFQYVAVALVNGSNILQLRFEDIKMTELLIAQSGELFLKSFYDTTNSYVLP
jgi:hypothetical protein